MYVMVFAIIKKINDSPPRHQSEKVVSESTFLCLDMCIEVDYDHFAFVIQVCQGHHVGVHQGVVTPPHDDGYFLKPPGGHELQEV